MSIEDKHGVNDLTDDVRHADDILNYCCQGCTNIEWTKNLKKKRGRKRKNET